jgi:hypothetical protein
MSETHGKAEILSEIAKLEQYLKENPQGQFANAVENRIAFLRKKLEER